MTYDITNYIKSDDTQIKREGFVGESLIARNPITAWIYNFVEGLVRWWTWKFIFAGVFVVIVAFFATGKTDIFKTVDKMSGHAASDRWGQSYSEFRKNTGFKSTKLNAHPVYNSELIKAWEKETGIKFNKIYKFIVIKGHDGGFEELLVMKKPAYDRTEKEPEIKKLELSSMIGDDAEDICDLYLGEIPTNYQKSFYSNKLNFSIRSIKDELTQENDDGSKYFRCVINHDSIKDLTE